MTARKIPDSNGSTAAQRQAQTALNRIKKRSEAPPLDAEAKRQAKLAAFERKRPNPPVLIEEASNEDDVIAAEKYIAETVAMYGRRLDEWVGSALGRRGLTLRPGSDGSGSVLIVLDQEAAAELLQSLNRAEYPDEAINASTAATLARFGRAR